MATELMTYEELARRLHCSVRKVRRIVSDGHLRPIRVGKRPLVTEREYEAYISAAYRRAL